MTCRLPLLLAALAWIAPAQGFIDATVSAGLTGTAPSQAFTFGTGGGFADLDGDGDMDFVLAGDPGTPFLVYRNDGGSFVLLPPGSGLGVATGIVRGIFAADVDNDGDQDLVVCNMHVPTQLFINQGNFTFTEEALARGVVNASGCYCAAFADYDRDGWLDLYLGNYMTATGQPAANKLFRNNGAGTFTDVSAAAGVADTGLALAVTFIDYDMDGWPDLYVANDRGGLASPNALYRNLGNGTFANVAASLGANFSMDSMGIDFLDAFNDGGYDIYISNGPMANVFAEYDGASQTYSNLSAAYGLLGTSVEGWFVKFLDWNNDGWQDLAAVWGSTRPFMYRNPGTGSGGGPWIEEGLALGIAAPEMKRAAAIADYDDDGRLDILFRYHAGPGSAPVHGVGLFRNQIPGGNWFRVALEGTKSNRDGQGSHLVLTAGGLVQRQQARSGVGYLMGNDPRIHFGLGSATQVDRLEIRWPSGTVQVLYGLAANQTLHVREPLCEFTGSLAAGSGGFSIASPAEAGLHGVLGISLSTSGGIPLIDGRSVPLARDAIFDFAINPGNPILPAPVGILDGTGRHSSILWIPPAPALTGLPFFACGVTYDAAHGPGSTFSSSIPLFVP